MSKGETMLTVRHVAERLGVLDSSVRIWARKGRFKGAKQHETHTGFYWLIPEAALAGFEHRGVGRPRKASKTKPGNLNKRTKRKSPEVEVTLPGGPNISAGAGQSRGGSVSDRTSQNAQKAHDNK